MLKIDQDQEFDISSLQYFPSIFYIFLNTCMSSVFEQHLFINKNHEINDAHICAYSARTMNDSCLLKIIGF